MSVSMGSGPALWLQNMRMAAKCARLQSDATARSSIIYVSTRHEKH
jgi:hypothetical protein